MTPERYQRVIEIFQAASDHSPEARPAFLAEACAGDDNLRRDVEAMLAADGESGGFLDRPADDLAAAAVAARDTRSLIGQRISHYEVVSLLGAGGMGEVYRAKDSRLNREVAIKFADGSFSDRFDREARAIAAINHPNICTLHDVGPNYLVMELVEGETLAERLKRGALPQEEALRIAKQIADALEAAHERGIVHRDLKPANIKIKPDGTVKVLDFGLAKSDQQIASGDNPRTTRPGLILGTAAYMSPEQARGQAVDKRTDAWSFGVVLYEMLTGRRAFPGETTTDVLAAVVSQEPDLDRVPAEARRLLRRCLEKDPKLRLRDIGDALPLLEDGPRIGDSRHQSNPWVVATACFALIAMLLAFAYFRRAGEAQRVLRLSALLPERGFQLIAPTVSPDGRQVVFGAKAGGKDLLWVRDLDSLDAHPLPGTDGANDPFWSPDSRFLGFFAGGKLKKINMAGGPALSLGDVHNARGGSWSKNDVIVFAPTNGSGLMRVAAAGGDATPVTALDLALSENSHRYPCFLPDGRHFIYTARSADMEKTAIYLGDLDSRIDSKTRRPILYAPSNAVYVSPGYLLFLRERTLMAQKFNAGKAQAVGFPVPVAEQVDYNNPNLWGLFSASHNGVLVYSSGGTGGSVQLTWFDRSGNVVGTVSTPGDLNWAAISPDGSRVAFDRRDLQTGLYDIWLHDLVRGTDSRFTFSQNNLIPVWSPDGRYIVFYSLRDGVFSLYQKDTNGTANDEALHRLPPTKQRWIGPMPVMDWSHDGRYIVEEIGGDLRTGYAIWVSPLFGDRKPFPYLRTSFNEMSAKLSPDGQWLAYVSDETRREEVYVQAFPTPGAKLRISANGGTLPLWSRDGKELFFVDLDRKLMAVEMKRVALSGGARLEASVPRPLFETRIRSGYSWFDVNKDGRFLMPIQTEPSRSAAITVVVNWTEGLKK